MDIDADDPSEERIPFFGMDAHAVDGVVKNLVIYPFTGSFSYYRNVPLPLGQIWVRERTNFGRGSSFSFLVPGNLYYFKLIGDFCKAERWFVKMNLCKCGNGHYYDADKYSVCPHCSGYRAPNLTEITAQNNYLPVDTLLKKRYLIKKVIGAGGFGIVYKGYDLLVHNEIAIKEYYPADLVGRNIGQNEIFIIDKSIEFFK